MRRLVWLLLAPQCFGYIQQSTNSASPVPIFRIDNTAIQFFLNNQIVPGVQSSASGSTVTVITADSNPLAAVRAGLATWNAVGTANVHFVSLESTNLVINPDDQQMTIAIGSTASDLSLVGGALAVTVITAAPVAGNFVNGQVQIGCGSNCQYPAGGIVDTDIIINPAKTFSTTQAANTYDLQGVMTHELGHSLGANHTGILGATMYQYNTPVERQLSSDDLAFVNATYPSTTSAVSFGSISGSVTVAGGGAALLTMVDTSSGATFGAVTADDGAFSTKVPPATYQMYAEPLVGVIPGGALLYFTPQLTAGSLQSTMFSGTVTVTANGIATANVTAASGPSALSSPGIAITTHNGPLPSGVILGGPVFVPSGGLVDMLIYGSGIDSSLTPANFTILGQGVTVSSVAPIAGTSPPTLRVTLNVTAQQSLSLASVFITKGTSTMSLSGALVIGPPTPTTTSESIISAASFVGNGSGNGAVTPGGIAALFDIPNNPNLGPVSGVGNSGYDPYGFLPSSLSGVAVTFDGVPAALFYVSGGQINLQAPFEIAGKTSTQMVVSYLGSPSAPIIVPVLASQPAIYTSCLVGSTQVACIVNPTADATGNYDNGPSSPAARGTTIQVFGTGVGILPAAGYPLQSGQMAPNPPISPNGYSCTIGGVNAPVGFAGWVATTVGLAQWNVQIPSSLTTTGKLPLVCTNGSQSTQSGVDVYVN